jgi:hypothetical protein
MIASSSTQLRWLAPATASHAQTAPDGVAPVATPDVSSDLQQLAASLASVRQSVDQLALQLASGQQQTGDNIARLHANEQEILQKLAAALTRPTAPVARKPVTAAAESSAQGR